MTVRSLLLSTCLFMVCASGVSAQIPMPGSKTETSTPESKPIVIPGADDNDIEEDEATAVEPVPVIDPNAANDFMVPQGETEARSKAVLRYDATQELVVQQKREQERAIEERVNGFVWMPLHRAGAKTFDFLLKRGGQVKNLQEAANYIDMAITDVDRDGKPDIILSHWDKNDCGITGCSFDIYFGNDLRETMFVKAQRVGPNSQGIQIDQNYYSFN